MQASYGYGHPDSGAYWGKHCDQDVLMKIMYGARFARPDLLRAVCALARRITEWDQDCDKRLLRLVSYIQSTLDDRLRAWIGDTLDKLEQHYYSDADIAGCVQTQRSTTGSFGMSWGPNSCFPIAMLRNRQTCVSHSTPEAELVAMDTILRAIALPSHIVWDTVPHAVESTVFGGNEAMLQVIKQAGIPLCDS